DTLEIHGVRIRLWGIDALENSQLCREDSIQYPCGAQAAKVFDPFIAGLPRQLSASQPRSVWSHDRDLFGRGQEYRGLACAAAFALHWRQHSKRRYHEAQRKAERTGQGLWKGSYLEPWLYRACVRTGGKPPACSDDA